MESVVEAYSLTDRTLPTIPVPHDCVISEISLAGDWLVFSFEEEIARHDCVRVTRPNARTLRMRFHLTETEFDLFVLERRRYETVFARRKPGKLFELAKRTAALEYLNHYVAYGAMQIELFQIPGSVIVGLCADRVEMEWVE